MKSLLKIIFTTQAALWCGLGFSQTWKQAGQGLSCFGDGGVDELYADIIHDRLMARGSLHFDGNCDTTRTVCIWDGIEWATLGEPMAWAQGHSIGMFNETIVMQGTFQPGSQNYYGNNLATWNGTSWDTIPQGPSDPGIHAIEQFGDWLYVGGTFNVCGGDSTKLVSRWNGEQWEKLLEPFEPMEYAIGRAIAQYNDTLFIGGGYYGNEEHTGRANCISSVYDLELHPVGVGLTRNSIVEALCVHHDTLWIGGTFPQGNFDDYPINSYLLTYANGELKPYPSQPNIRVTALKSYKDALYIGGWFQGEDAEPVWDGCMNIAMLHHGEIYCLNYGAPLNGSVKDIEVFRDTLYAGGDMWAFGDTLVRNIAYLDWPLSNIMALVDPYWKPQSVDTTISLVIYPNPTSGLVQIHSPDTISSLQVFDITGRQIISVLSNSKQYELDLRHQSLGSYICRMNFLGGTTITKKIILLK